MARYEVYEHPDPELRRKTPFLLDVQNTFLDTLGTRVVLPLREAGYLPRARHEPELHHRRQSCDFGYGCDCCFSCSLAHAPC
jgi:CcdB protein